jgi:hypothetical protein
MAVTNFSPLLGLALPTTGDLSGTWGTTVNDSITGLLDSAVAGTTTLSTDANVTLSTTNGAANQARNAVLLCTGSRAALRTITAPAQSKAYVVINATTGGFGVKVVGSGPTTGVTINSGEKALIAWNGSDFVIVSSSIIDLTSEVTGTLPVANGGTGVTSSTGTGNVVLSNSPTLVTPALGTPSSATLTNATGLPISTGVSGLGTGVATFLATPSSANLRTAVTDETGTGALVFATSPTLVTPALGTPSALVGTNITGTASGLTAGNVTTNANLTGAVTSVGNTTSLGSFTSAQLAGALTDETGSGSAVFATSPTLVTPALGTPSSATLTNATGLPIDGGTTGTLPINRGGTGTTSTTFVNLTTNVTGTLPLANGGTNATTAPNARTNLGATTLGGNLFTITNPSAITFPRFNADNTVSSLDAASFLTAIGAGSGSGTVSSVSGTGTVNGITLTGTVTSSGNLTLGGTLSGVSLSTQVSGTLPVANGGTGQTTYTNGQLLIGNTTGNTLAKATLTAGSGVSITNGAGSITIAATGGSGTVTSVSGTGTVSGLSLSGTVTTSGNLTLGGTLAVTPSNFASQTAKTVLAAPNAAAGVPTFRLLVASDIPTLNQNTTGSAATLTTARTLTIGSTGKTFNGSANVTWSLAEIGAGDVTLTGTQTLTNKRINPRVVSAASASSLTPSIATADQYAYTALAAGLTINAPTGTPVNGDKLIFRLLDNGTARALTWNATFTAIGVTLPTTTVANKTTYVGCIYNAHNTRWDVIAVTTQA